MKIVNVVLRVKQGHAEEFLALQREMAVAFEEVDGTLAFVVSQSDADPHELRLFEVYRDEAAFQEHLRFGETLPGRAQLVDLVDGPFHSVHGSRVAGGAGLDRAP